MGMCSQNVQRFPIAGTIKNKPVQLNQQGNLVSIWATTLIQRHTRMSTGSGEIAGTFKYM